MEKAILLAGILLLLSGVTSAEVIVFELGDHVLIVDQEFKNDDFVKNYISIDVDQFGFHFHPITELLSPTALDWYYFDGDITFRFWNLSNEKNVNVNDSFIWTPHRVGNVSVGRLRQVRAALYTGEFGPENAKKTPYYVYFQPDNNTGCRIYSSDTTRTSFMNFLHSMDIISKKEIGDYIQVLWSRVEHRDLAHRM